MLADPQTTITIRQSTLKVLQAVKAAGESYDDLLLALVEESYSPVLLKELKRRIAPRSLARARPIEELYRRWGV
ncbi:MAG: hypothetical protein KGJ23_11395 [Euryarchaeota archaeon]|nr:hypothetical protein [Euryarchaeota archaeon]MDE1837199.1 hypothetical protein [Euryarchaeota archaeon]MDE1882085.1 hypothetical protein [Euryarchaeota archaeon]MDE2045355.1 hypothetical protein [Thermoplasmata archaeon]